MAGTAQDHAVDAVQHLHADAALGRAADAQVFAGHVAVVQHQVGRERAAHGDGPMPHVETGDQGAVAVGGLQQAQDGGGAHLAASHLKPAR